LQDRFQHCGRGLKHIAWILKQNCIHIKLPQSIFEKIREQYSQSSTLLSHHMTTQKKPIGYCESLQNYVRAAIGGVPKTASHKKFDRWDEQETDIFKIKGGGRVHTTFISKVYALGFGSREAEAVLQSPMIKSIY